MYYTYIFLNFLLRLLIWKIYDCIIFHCVRHSFNIYVLQNYTQKKLMKRDMKKNHQRYIKKNVLYINKRFYGVIIKLRKRIFMKILFNKKKEN